MNSSCIDWRSHVSHRLDKRSQSGRHMHKCSRRFEAVHKNHNIQCKQIHMLRQSGHLCRSLERHTHLLLHRSNTEIITYLLFLPVELRS